MASDWAALAGIIKTVMQLHCALTAFCLQVEALPVYFPSAEERATPALFAANVRKLMGERLGAKLVDQGIGHNVALRKAGVGVDFTGKCIVSRKPTTLR